MQNIRQHNEQQKKQHQQVAKSGKGGDGKSKIKDPAFILRQGQPRRRLEQTKDVVLNVRKEHSRKGQKSRASSKPARSKSPKRRTVRRKLVRPQQFGKQTPKGPQEGGIVARKKESHGFHSGIARKNLRSREPSVCSLLTLTNRVKRRDEERLKTMKASCSWEDEKGAQIARKSKKADDNYKEVFPDVKLEFDNTTTPDPQTQGSHLLSLSASEPDPSFTGESTTECRKDEILFPTLSSGFPEEETQLLPLASTQKQSNSLLLAPTPEQRSRLQSTQSKQTRSRSKSLNTGEGTLPHTGLPVIRNKNNNGKLFVNGLPFWVEPMPEDLTDEGNVLNAAVILDVVSGKLSLVSMPDEQITLDVYEEWSVLRSRDATCFNKDVLFGNTIRSMVNLLRDPYTRSLVQQEKSVRPTSAYARCQWLILRHLFFTRVGISTT